jgi:pyruvate carboxylase subunit B
MKKIDVMITAFRDGFQSVFGARVSTKDFIPALESARDAGITHFEAGGGARFQSLFFYCNENAFDMMDTFRETTGPEANLQTLSRGINVVGLDSQSKDIIELHALMFKKHGMTTIRNFDALNDVNNLIFSGQCIHEAGLKHEVCVTMMELPPAASQEAHTPEFYIDVLKKILDAGIPFDSVCFKDASGTSTPTKVYDTIKLARETLGENQKIVFHTHETAGTSVLCYKAAMEAGADQIDCSLAPVSGGTSQPDIITLWHTMRGTEFEMDVDIKKVIETERIFKECMADYFIPPESKAVEPLTPFSPMPGGALTANTQMMRDAGILDRYAEVADAMGEVVAKGGFGTSVTPVSQFYFQQAFNNVMIGKWKKIAEGYGKMVLGYFGKTPVEPDPEVVKLASEQLKLEPTTQSPLEINDQDPNKGKEAAKKTLEEAQLPLTDENIFIAATCKEKGIAFLKGEAALNVRKKSEEKPEAAAQGKPAPSKPVPSSFSVTVNNRTYSVKLEDGHAVVDGTDYRVAVAEGGASTSAAPAAGGQTPSPAQPAGPHHAASEPGSGAGSGERETVSSPLPGTVMRILQKPGSSINAGDVIMIIESMKMETDVTSPVKGILQEILVEAGGQIQTGDVLAVISTKAPEKKIEETAPPPSAPSKPPQKKETQPQQPTPQRTVRPAGSKAPTSRKKGERPVGTTGIKEEVKAPLPGQVIRIDVGPGTRVNQGDVILIIESMKMETDITSPVTGIIDRIAVMKNDQVKADDLLAVIST